MRKALMVNVWMVAAVGFAVLLSAPKAQETTTGESAATRMLTPGEHIIGHALHAAQNPQARTVWALERILRLRATGADWNVVLHEMQKAGLVEERDLRAVVAAYQNAVILKASSWPYDETEWREFGDRQDAIVVPGPSFAGAGDAGAGGNAVGSGGGAGSDQGHGRGR